MQPVVLTSVFCTADLVTTWVQWQKRMSKGCSKLHTNSAQHTQALPVAAPGLLSRLLQEETLLGGFYGWQRSLP